MIPISIYELIPQKSACDFRQICIGPSPKIISLYETITTVALVNETSTKILNIRDVTSVVCEGHLKVVFVDYQSDQFRFAISDFSKNTKFNI